MPPTPRPKPATTCAGSASKGLIRRLEHSNTYVLTSDGQRIALFYTKVDDRLLRPLTAADRPPASIPVRNALRTLDHAVQDYIDQERLAA